MTDHSSGKLHVGTGAGEGGIFTADGQLVADCYGENWQENARRLCLAWNCHDELVTALRCMLALAEWDDDDSSEDSLERAEAALARAEGRI